MSVDLILFLILALVAVATALGMLLSRNAVYSALFLVLNFGTVAVFYLLLDAPFIALTQITVYAGAIMVLFLFVIMLLGAEHISSEFSRRGLIFPVILALILAAEATFLLFGRNMAPGIVTIPNADSLGTPVNIGTVLFNQYLLPFEVTSILLLVAMVGAIVLTLKKKGEQE